MTALNVGEVATIAHGYTMAEVDRFTRTAVHGYRRGFSTVDYSDRWDAAWFAIIEHLYESPERPDIGVLVNMGRAAIRSAINAHFHHHGIAQVGAVAAPSFGKFWLPVAGPRPDFAENLAERLALPQVLAALTADEYSAVAALAVMGNHRAAALSLGVSLSAFNSRLRRARTAVNALWFEHETPRRRKSSDEACLYGHLRDEHSRLTARGWVCLVCQRAADRRRNARERGALGASELEAEPEAFAQADRPAASGADGDPAELLAG